jgi:hypothetical protein
MAVVNDDGVHEDHFESVVQTLPPELKRVYITAKADAEKPAEEGTVLPEPYGLNPPERGPGVFPEPSPRPTAQVLYTTSSPLVNITDHDIEDATNVAMSAGPGTMAGVVSKTVDKGALAVAQAAEKEGISAREITDKTGFFKGADGRWKYEIDDSAAKFNPDWADNPSPTQKASGMKIVKLPEVIDHPELYEAYPRLKDYQVIYDNNFRGIAEFSGEAIRLGKAAYTGTLPAYKDKSVIMHEVQHAIQDMEGFAKGGSPMKSTKGEYKLKYENDVNKLRPALIDLLGKERKGEVLSPQEEYKLDYLKTIFDKYVEYQKAGDKKAFDHYLALAGEVEARNVQTRVDLTPAERQRFHPIDTEDVPRSEQLARTSATGTTPYRVNNEYVSY